ncbi:phospholipase A1 member A-like [Wyeomyia smithii]|uniref:phospholipase A1 member A-like n=1 Tax=Wyeomyia smithii TaxID=174621 RepID=UPI002467FBF3|nr:phospholipase A1 member A-like [Wyeomyia smithii]
MMSCLLKVFIVVLLGRNVSAGLLDIFSATSDYDAAFLMDSLFGIVANTTKYIISGGATNPIETDVTFWCGNRNSPNLELTTINDENLGSKITTSKPIAFIVHGWLDNRSRNWVRAMTTDYLKYLDTNVCVVDWGNLAIYSYAIAANNTVRVGVYLAQFLAYLNKQGISLSQITLVGHSMGAHVSGIAGMNLGGKIGAIYGLDPASPLFKMPFDIGTAKRLDKTDALYVQMIITSRCTWGVCTGDGHENFYPTGGIAPQPNCVVPLFSNAEAAEPIICSHAHSNTLYRMALNPRNVFDSKKCSSYAQFLLGLCYFNKSTKMGIYSIRIGGDFYLMTSISKPYTV